MHVFGLWEEAGVPGENPGIYGENTQTPHRKAPAGKIRYESNTFSSSPLGIKSNDLIFYLESKRSLSCDNEIN